MALNATDGNASAEVYADEAYALAYFATHLLKDRWQAVVDKGKDAAALLAAMPILEDQEYMGLRSTTTQALEFPRTAPYINRTAEAATSIVEDSWTDKRGRVWLSDETPKPVKQAHCELALIVGENEDWFEHRYKEKAIKTGETKITARVGRELVGLPNAVFRLLRPFLLNDRESGRTIR